MKSIGELPPPPVISSPLAHTAANPVGGRPFLMATATCEPAKPNRFRRVLQKVPGLRNLQHSFSSTDSFAPPRPVRPIEFMLPSDASPALLDTPQMDLKASVSESGAVTRVELLTPKDEALVTLASYAANQWQFVPARLNDRPVASQVILHFRFDGNQGR